MTQVLDQPLWRRPDSSVDRSPARVGWTTCVSPLLCVAQPRVPLGHRAHEPRHGLSGMHFYKVGVRVGMNTCLCPFLPARSTIHCQVVLFRATRRVLDPFGVPSLAELVRPPDGQLQPPRACASAPLRR